MVSFARARTKSMLSRLWSIKAKPINNQTLDMQNTQKKVHDVMHQNKCFFEASKNGGIWFS